VRWKIK